MLEWGNGALVRTHLFQLASGSKLAPNAPNVSSATAKSAITQVCRVQHYMMKMYRPCWGGAGGSASDQQALASRALRSDDLMRHFLDRLDVICESYYRAARSTHMSRRFACYCRDDVSQLQNRVLHAAEEFRPYTNPLPPIVFTFKVPQSTR